MPPNPSHPRQAYANPINSTLKWPVSNNLLTLTLSQIRATFGHAFKLLQKSFPKARTVHKLSIFHTLCSSENSKVCDNEPCPSVLTLRPFPQNAVSPGVDRGQQQKKKLRDWWNMLRENSAFSLCALRASLCCCCLPRSRSKSFFPRSDKEKKLILSPREKIIINKNFTTVRTLEHFLGWKS